MHKQNEFFRIIANENLTLGEYKTLYILHSSKKVLTKDQVSKYLKDHDLMRVYLDVEGKVTSKGLNLIKRIDALFKPAKKIKALNALGEDYQINIDRYIDTFPKGKLPNNQYAQGNKKGIEDNFKWFFQEYSFSWETILEATDKYVADFKTDNYKFMRTAFYFIKKQIDGQIISDLANYCEAVLSGDHKEKVVFKRKVV